jgi:hypothetical protein
MRDIGEQYWSKDIQQKLQSSQLSFMVASLIKEYTFVLEISEEWQPITANLNGRDGVILLSDDS